MATYRECEGNTVKLETYDAEIVTEHFRAREYDFFILAPNIERRSKAAYHTIVEYNKINCIIAANYESFHIDNTIEQEESILADFPEEKLVVIDAKDDAEFFHKIIDVKIEKQSSLAFDMTGFSIPTIYKIMHYLKKIVNIEKIDVFYTEPKHYVYKEAYFDSYHLETENRLCEPISGYYNSGDNESEVLTIFLGFDYGLAEQVYHKLGDDMPEIKRTIAVNGFPSYTAKLKDISLYNNEFLVEDLEDDVMTVTANNPFDSYNLLCSIKEQHPDLIINLCTIGCKPMALGTCLFALDNLESVKVTYPYYRKTKFDADEEAGKVWRYGVVFSYE